MDRPCPHAEIFCGSQSFDFFVLDGFGHSWTDPSLSTSLDSVGTLDGLGGLDGCFFFQRKGSDNKGVSDRIDMRRMHDDANWPGLVGHGRKYVDREEGVTVWRGVEFHPAGCTLRARRVWRGVR